MRQVILNFHGIGQAARPLEADEAPYWVSREIFEKTILLAEKHEERVRVDITFDDGNLSDIEIALPILTDHNRRATFFVLADRIGSPGSLSAADIRALVRAGHRIGTHGAAHIDWKTADAVKLERELGATTRAAIATAAGQPVTQAAIPFGRYNRTVLRALLRQGYDEVYSSDGGPWRPGQWPVPRTSPHSDMSLKDIENIILGPEPMKLRLRRFLARSRKRLL